MTGYSDYYDTFAVGMLNAVNAPITLDNRDALVAWIGGEVGWSGTNVAVQRNNPLNIKLNSFRSFGIPVDGKQLIQNVSDGTQAYGTFTTPERGARATAEYLANAPYYKAAIAALQASHGVGFLNAIAASPWAASHYGYPRHNHLLDNFAYVQQAGHPLGSVPTPPAPKPEGTDEMLNLSPTTYHRVVDIPAGTVLTKTPGGDTYTTLGKDATLGFIGATATHYCVADGDAGVYLDRSTKGVAVRTADQSAGV